MRLTLTSFLSGLVAFAVLAGTASAGHHEKGEMVAEKDIVATAVANGNFKTLAAALKAAGLVDTLRGEGPFTVFAPTDAAFKKLPEGTVAELLKPENKKKLIAVLTYHVVPGKVMAKQAVKLDSAETVNGKSLTLKVMGEKLHVDNATVVAADVEASNGVIHVIDSVVLPNAR
ncbi:MAG: fasciclin domain-containing protein [Pseudomonadota bacterium]